MPRTGYPKKVEEILAAEGLDNFPPPKSRGLLGICKPGEAGEFAVKNAQVLTPAKWFRTALSRSWSGRVPLAESPSRHCAAVRIMCTRWLFRRMRSIDDYEAFHRSTRGASSHSELQPAPSTLHPK